MALAHAWIADQVRRRARPDDVALLDHHMAVGEFEQRVDMFVDQENGLALGFQPFEARPDLVADERRQALGRLIRLRPIASICCSPPES